MHRTIREFGDLLQHGKALLPISQTMPLIHLMGDVCVAWLLFWQAGVATKALAGQRKRHGVDFGDPAEKAEFLGRNEEAGRRSDPSRHGALHLEAGGARHR